MAGGKRLEGREGVAADVRRHMHPTHRLLCQLERGEHRPLRTASAERRRTWRHRPAHRGERRLSQLGNFRCIAAITFEADLPHATGDLRFQLERSPNFTRMAPQPDVFIQLALLCLRAPQSLLDLQRSFSRHDPRLVTLFVVCAVLSGTATVLPSVADVKARQSEPPAPAKRRNLPGLQFFRSLLEKLF